MSRTFEISRGGSLIDAINRKAAATGSMRYAQLAADADYNGHFVTVAFNSYRGYWVAEYTWAGRNVLGRGEFALCLRTAMDEYNRGAKFATVRVYPQTPEEEAACLAAGLKLVTDDNSRNPFYTDPMMLEINGAFMYEQQLGIPAVGYLANSKTVEEYRAKVDEALAARRPVHA